MITDTSIPLIYSGKVKFSERNYSKKSIQQIPNFWKSSALISFVSNLIVGNSKARWIVNRQLTARSVTFRWRSCTWTRPCSNSTRCQRSRRPYCRPSRLLAWQWTSSVAGKNPITSRTWPIHFTNTSAKRIEKREVSKKQICNLARGSVALSKFFQCETCSSNLRRSR